MKIYESIQGLFDDGIFTDTDIVIGWGKRGRGKSSGAGWFMSEFMKRKQAKKDVRESRNIAEMLKPAGYCFETPDDHTVFCDTYFEKRGFLRKRTSAYRFNPIRWGLPNDVHETDLICPCGRYFFDEGQSAFDSHVSALAGFVTGGMELSRQAKLFLFITAQRPMRLHKDIRDLATFVEFTGVKKIYNKYGRIMAVEWKINIIYENGILEKYLETRDPNLIDKTIKLRYKGNIFKCYDTNYFLPMFYRKFQHTHVTFEKSKRTEFDEESFKEFFEHRVIDIPDTYRGKKQKESTNKTTEKGLKEEISILKKMVAEMAKIKEEKKGA